MNKSIVLSAAFPSSKTNPERLRLALDKIRPFYISTVEYYIENFAADKAANILSGWESVFLSAALQKQMGLNPSSEDAAERKRAVDLLADSMRYAVQSGAAAVLLNSGERPMDEKKDEECLKHLRESLCELSARSGGIDILIEPGDRDVEYRHLLGHTRKAHDFIQDIRRDIPNIGLVFDISHIAQLGEKLEDAWSIARQSCSHVHLANCSLVKDTKYYGDKHPPFGIKHGIYSHADAFNFYRSICKEKRPMTVGIEIICQGESEEIFFDHITDETGWFFHKRQRLKTAV